MIEFQSEPNFPLFGLGALIVADIKNAHESATKGKYICPISADRKPEL